MDFYENILNLSKMILVPVFSTYIGASFAFKNQKKKQTIDDEKDKLVTALSWFLEAENCLLSLTQIKKCYFEIGDSGKYRTINLKYQIVKYERIDLKNITKLHFLLDSNFEIDALGFRNYFKIKKMFTTYNQIIDRWEKIQNQKSDINEVISNYIGTDATFQITDELIDIITPLKLSNYLVLAEATIELIDQTLSDFMKFIDEFVTIANESIDLRLLKSVGLKRYKPASDVLSIYERRIAILNAHDKESIENIVARHSSLNKQ